MNTVGASIGLTIDQFYEARTNLPTVKITNIRKGPVCELSQR